MPGARLLPGALQSASWRVLKHPLRVLVWEPREPRCEAGKMHLCCLKIEPSKQPYQNTMTPSCILICDSISL